MISGKRARATGGRVASETPSVSRRKRAVSVSLLRRALGHEARAHRSQGAAAFEGGFGPRRRRVAAEGGRFIGPRDRSQDAREEFRGIVFLAKRPLEHGKGARGRGLGHLALDPAHHDVGPGLAVLVDGVLEAVQPLVYRAQVEVDLGLVLGQLEGFEEGRLGVFEAIQLEGDEAEVVVEGVGLGALRHQLAVDLLRLLELVLLEVDEAEQVQDLGVAGAQEVGLLQLTLRFVQALGVVHLLALVEVGEE